jgi:uncharacterized SAM-binding protein YcdF (DUF218 family)
MFYFLSKILFALVAPMSLIIILFLIFAVTKIKSYFWWAFGLLVFFTNPWLAQSVMGLYEVEPIALSKKNQYDAIIIPSGFVSNYNVDGQLRVVFNDGTDRMLQAIDLFKRGISDKIIYTGGADTIFGAYEPEAEMSKTFMVKCGIPDSAIVIETKSINTYQNAAFTAKMLEKKDPNFKNKKYLLVTAGYHMRRALACFEKQGFNVDGYSTDPRSMRSKNTVLNTLLPNYGGFQTWTYLVKEWIGLLVYKLKGYI